MRFLIDVCCESCGCGMAEVFEYNTDTDTDTEPVVFQCNNCNATTVFQVTPDNNYVERTLKEKTTREILGPWTYDPNFVFDYEDSLASPCLVYDDDLVIELMEDQYFLVLGNQQYVSEDLCYLEELFS